MRRILLPAIILASLMSTLPVSAQEEKSLTVVNWSIEVKSAVKAPFFMDIIHLGALDDGRDWLAVTMVITNTTDQEQEIHSDRIRLRSEGELIKQTGEESEVVASELGYKSIGGSFPHDVEARSVMEVIQVYKVDPASADFTLVFDFSGEWEIPIADLVAQSASDPRHLVISGDPNSLSAERSPGSIQTASYNLTLVGAVVGTTFTGPFHLGSTGDGRNWLVATYRFENLKQDKTELKADAHKLLVGGEEIKQATDETRSVSNEIGLRMLTLDLEPGESVEVVQVFKVDSAAEDFTLQVSARGKLYLDLVPVITQAAGDPLAVVPGTAPELPEGTEQPSSEINTVPTEIPTPTQQAEPTDVPEPTQDAIEAPPSESGEPTSVATATVDQNADSELIVVLEAANSSGISGDATLSESSGGFVEVSVLVDGAAGDHPAFIQTGDCENRGDLIGTLNDVDANGMSDSLLEVPFDDLSTGTIGPAIVAIYSTWPNAEVLYSCGEIPQAAQLDGPSESASNLSDEESEYQIQILAQSQVMASSLNRFSGLMSSDSMFSADWMANVQAEIVIWQQVYQDALAITPPPKFATTHALYLQALEHYSLAGDLILYGIENVDVSAIDLAVLEMELGIDLLEQATASLAELEE